MRAEELFVEVRDRNLKRQGRILPRDLSLRAKLRWCAVGEWELTLPSNHTMVSALSQEGSGIIVRGPRPGGRGVMFSGPTVLPERKRDLKNPDGTLTFKGVTDEIHLDDALAFPSPAVANPAAQTTANDVRTGGAESLMRAYVNANLVPGTAPAGRVRGFRSKMALEPTNLGRGITLTKSPRFQNLLELLQEIAVAATLGFRVVQVNETLQFQVVTVRDQRSLVRLDINNGTVTSEQVQQQGPGLTDAIVAGQGEGTDRTIVRVWDGASESTWSRVIERFFDRRDTDNTTELTQKGQEELLNATGGVAVKVVPSDDQTMRYGHDWTEGDWVTVVVNGQEADSVVTEAVILANSTAVIVGAAIGDVSKFDPKDVQSKKQEGLDSRIGYLERASAGPVTADRLPSGGTVLSGTVAERDARFGVPATDSERVALANRKVQWFNTDYGWIEQYLAPSNLSGITARALLPGIAAGWYPVERNGPRAYMQSNGAIARGNGQNFNNWNDFGVGQSRRNSPFFTRLGGGDAMAFQMAGFYRLTHEMSYPAGSGTGVVGLYAVTATTLGTLEKQYPVPLIAAYGQVITYEYSSALMQVGATFFQRTVAASWTIGNTNSFLAAEYLGPAYANFA